MSWKREKTRSKSSQRSEAQDPFPPAKTRAKESSTEPWPSTTPAGGLACNTAFSGHCSSATSGYSGEYRSFETTLWSRSQQCDPSHRPIGTATRIQPKAHPRTLVGRAQKQVGACKKAILDEDNGWKTFVLAGSLCPTKRVVSRSRQSSKRRKTI